MRHIFGDGPNMGDTRILELAIPYAGLTISLPKANFYRFFLDFRRRTEQILKHETSTADEITRSVVLLASLLRPGHLPPAAAPPQYLIVVRVVIQISEK